MLRANERISKSRQPISEPRVSFNFLSAAFGASGVTFTWNQRRMADGFALTKLRFAWRSPYLWRHCREGHQGRQGLSISSCAACKAANWPFWVHMGSCVSEYTCCLKKDKQSASMIRPNYKYKFGCQLLPHADASNFPVIRLIKTFLINHIQNVL